MAHTRIKICGITRIGDAQAAAEAGADAIGLVFYPSSPRAVSLTQAALIARAVPPFVTVVGLFVNASEREIAAALAAVPVDVLQFHGDEPAEFCRGFERPWIKALRMRADADPVAASAAYPDARGILLDSFVEGQPGGTGLVFDWRMASGALARPLILAGGLDEHNVAAGIAALRPAAVDVSGGVESAPGCKDAQKIRRFIAAVRAADAGTVSA